MKQGSLKRVIVRREVLALAFGAMIGWSWVALTGTWLEQAGALGAILAFIAGGGALILVGRGVQRRDSLPERAPVRGRRLGRHRRR